MTPHASDDRSRRVSAGVVALLIPIEGYKNKDAAIAFQAYENIDSEIRPGATTTTIVTTMGGFNYVEFKVQPRTDTLIERVDGATVMAAVLDTDGELLVRDRRMAFVRGSTAHATVKSLQDGECMHVLGMPRINLTLVSWRKSAEGRARGALTWSLPYEMVIVGLINDSKACAVEE